MSALGIKEIKSELLHELYMMKLFPMYEKLEGLIQKLPPEELYDETDDMSLINIAIVQDNPRLFEMVHKYQPASKRITVFIEFDRMDLFLHSFLKLNPKESIDLYSKDEYLLTHPIESAFHSKNAFQWFRIFKELGMDFNHKYEPCGETCLHMLQQLTTMDKARASKLLEFLVVECGADINAQEKIFNWTPVMSLCLGSGFGPGSFSILESCLKLGANLEIKDRRDMIFLDYVFLHPTIDADFKIVKMCVEHMFCFKELEKKSYFFRIESIVRDQVEKRKHFLFDFLFC